MVICLELGANGPADATTIPSSLAPVKSRMVYLSGACLPGCPGKKATKLMSSSSSFRADENLVGTFSILSCGSLFFPSSITFTNKRRHILHLLYAVGCYET